MSDGEPVALEHAGTAVASLEPLDRCRNPAELAGPVPPSGPATRKRLDEVNALVARAEAQRSAGQYRDATATAERALAGARELDFVPTLAAALFVSGQLAARAAHFDRATKLLGEAQVAAQESRDDRLAARVDLGLAALAAEQEHGREAAQWTLLADGAIRRLGGDSQIGGDLSPLRR